MKRRILNREIEALSPLAYTIDSEGCMYYSLRAVNAERLKASQKSRDGARLNKSAG